ncbi:M4 family metallopeptidase [Dawidia soli]|uniref:Neutral metalloproteinase n=1 Tax=Dawidia soli TaxID=2782352 RepID=A0AAP2DF26_9BACT|nr:M4 family metallopeptidase [Dawidia soli]MBT1690658.1 M4 family metallopeptidase [Dawidia soli]
MRRRILLAAVIGIFLAGHGQAQQHARAVTTAPGTPGTGGDNHYYGNPLEPPRAIEFKKGTVTAAQFLADIHRYLGVPADFTFAEAEPSTDKLGMRHHLLQQYYKGIALEGMDYRVHEKEGYVVSANGKAVRNIALEMQTPLSKEQAGRLAGQYLHAADTAVRPGRTLIVSKGFTFAPESFAIAYQFDVEISLVERWRVSIDARTGGLINQVSLVNSCGHEDPPPLPYLPGTGLTNYYGNQTIRVEQTGSGTRLVGQTEHGGLLGTYDYRNQSVTPLLNGFPATASDVTSASTNYAGSTRLKAAVSVQWAAEQAFEYYYQKHGRNSFDNRGGKITSYVHVDVGLDNAFWNGRLLAFGDGSRYKTLVELDVVSHELTHGVTQYEAGLLYYNEPGALNESFSDILAKAVEFHRFGDTATWQMGKHLIAGGLRDFSNPNVKNQPDTYQGDLWYTGTGDNGGVHYNSGVQNFWFYLLCNGGSGVNDHDSAYAVTAIGMDAAVNIAYRNLTEYLGPASDYLDSRFGSLLAAADLYGKNSAIYRAVDNAWDAVGVIDEPGITSLEPYDITATTTRLRGTLIPRGDSVR